MNNYRIISDIGSGAYSTVHKAIDINTGHIVAIKKISQQNMNLKQIISRQVNFLNQCINHPNIIQLHKCFSLGNFTFLVFQYMPMDLISYYKSVQQSKKRNLNDQQICYISYQLCSALNFLHKKGIMHRDIKPQNILIDPQNLKIKLIDFGFAKQNNSPGNLNTNYMVTRWYRSLQIVLNLPYNEKVDVFATGALILELYLGHQIFRSSSNIDQLYWIVNICGFPYGWKSAIMEMNKLGINIDELSSTKPNSGNSGGSPSKKTNLTQLKQLTKQIRPLAVDLIVKMLKTSPDQRITMSQACQHPYFSRFKIRKNLILNQQPSNQIDDSINYINKQNNIKIPTLNRNHRAFSSQNLPQFDSGLLSYRQKTEQNQNKKKNEQKQPITYRNGSNKEINNQLSGSVKKQKQQSITGMLNCQLLHTTRLSNGKRLNTNERQQNNQNYQIHQSEYTMIQPNGKNFQNQKEQYLIKRKSSSDNKNQYLGGMNNKSAYNKEKDQLSKQKNLKSKPIQIKNNYVRPTVRNRVKSLNQHGINVISLKKLKVHRQIDNVKSKQKVNQYKQVQKPKQNHSTMIKLQPKRNNQKDKPMFMKVKDKINQGRLNERGMEDQVINSNYNNSPYSNTQYSQHNYVQSNLKTQNSYQNNKGGQISTKLVSSASMKLKKLPEYKEYRFGNQNNNY